LTSNNFSTVFAFLQEEFFKMRWTINLAFMDMKGGSLANGVITNTAREAFQMKLLIHGFENSTIDLLLTLGAFFGVEFTEARVTIRLCSMFTELVSWKRVAAFRANKVLGMPSLIQRLNILSFNYFTALTAFGVEIGVVVILAIEIAVFFDECFATKFTIALYTSEMICMECHSLCNDIRGSHRLFARMTNSIAG